MKMDAQTNHDAALAEAMFCIVDTMVGSDPYTLIFLKRAAEQASPEARAIIERRIVMLEAEIAKAAAAA